jgi:hypothetical protein
MSKNCGAILTQLRNLNLPLNFPAAYNNYETARIFQEPKAPTNSFQFRHPANQVTSGAVAKLNIEACE